jgi:hypothetical protein
MPGKSAVLALLIVSLEHCVPGKVSHQCHIVTCLVITTQISHARSHRTSRGCSCQALQLLDCRSACPDSAGLTPCICRMCWQRRVSKGSVDGHNHSCACSEGGAALLVGQSWQDIAQLPAGTMPLSEQQTYSVKVLSLNSRYSKRPPWAGCVVMFLGVLVVLCHS